MTKRNEQRTINVAPYYFTRSVDGPSGGWVLEAHDDAHKVRMHLTSWDIAHLADILCEQLKVLRRQVQTISGVMQRGGAE